MTDINHKIKKYEHKLSNLTNESKFNLYMKKIDHYHHLSQMSGGKSELKKPKMADITGYSLTNFLDNPHKIEAVGYGTTKVNTDLEPMSLERRVPGPHDVVVEIWYAGICHSDWHSIVGEWDATFPLIPGHEIAGKVIRIGNKVINFHVGENVAVGTLVNSCRVCDRCKEQHQQYCENGSTGTYDDIDRKPDEVGKNVEPTGDRTYGGFTNVIVVDENFVFKLPKNIPLEAAAPLLCAGITTYSPLKQFGVTKGTRVGIAGIGGLGHLAVKEAKAMGAYVVALTTTKWKLSDAVNHLGADEAVLVTNKKDMEKHASSLDLILSTIPKAHDIEPYINLLKYKGTLWIVGALFPMPDINPIWLASIDGSIRSSITGGIQETKEMLQFCSKHNIMPDIEIIPIKDINKTHKKLLKSEVRYRFVIDTNSLAARN